MIGIELSLYIAWVSIVIFTILILPIQEDNIYLRLCYFLFNFVFILQSVFMVYHIDWFVYIEESLHPWDKSHLIMMYDPFSVLLDSGC